MVAGTRGPNARLLNWNAPNVDFPAVTNISLQPGWEYEYRQNRTFDLPGDYFVEPAWLDTSDTWQGIMPFPRIEFNVRQRQTIVTPTYTPTALPFVAPGRLELIEPLRVSNTNPQINQSINARYRVRNVGGRPIALNFIGVKGRHSSGSSYDFFWQPNVTLQPGQEFAYDANRSFDRSGLVLLTPNYNDGDWHDLRLPDGGNSSVTISVASAPVPAPPTITSKPPPTTTPKPATPGRLVLIEGLVISPNNPTHGQSVNARYRIKNDGGQPITLRFLGVKGRHSSGASYDFFWMENVTLQPSQEMTYDTNRVLDRTGSYTFTPSYNDGANWIDVKWSNGSNNTVIINAR
jgi:hypothetical protein